MKAGNLSVTQEQMARVLKGETVELVPGKDGHSIRLNPDKSFEYIPNTPSDDEPQNPWELFDAAIDMVINTLDNYDSNELATMSVWDFIEQAKEDILEEAQLYKTEG